MAVILFWAAEWGKDSGQEQTKAQFISQTAQSVQQSLNYFYKDQDRFPTAAEFESRQVMSSYLTVVPPQQVPTTQCPSSLAYKRLTAGSYQLNFCLPASYGMFHRGWNTIGEDRG